MTPEKLDEMSGFVVGAKVALLLETPTWGPQKPIAATVTNVRKDGLFFTDVTGDSRFKPRGGSARARGESRKAVIWTTEHDEMAAVYSRVDRAWRAARAIEAAARADKNGWPEETVRLVESVADSVSPGWRGK